MFIHVFIQLQCEHFEAVLRFYNSSMTIPCQPVGICKIIVIKFSRESKHIFLTHAMMVIVLNWQVKYAVQMNSTIGFPLALATPAVADCHTPPPETRFAVLGGSMMAMTSSAVVDRLWAKISSAVGERNRVWCTVAFQVREPHLPFSRGRVSETETLRNLP